MGKMTRTILMAALLLGLATPGAIAQSLFFGVKAGVSIPNLTSGGSDPVSSGYSSIAGPYFGVFGDLGLSHHWGLQAELNYSAQGGQKNGAQALPSSAFAAYFPPGYQAPPYFYANYSAKARLNYLELPILAKFKVSLGGAWKFEANLGPYVGYLLNAKSITSDSSNIYLDPAMTQPLPVGKQDFTNNMSITSDIHRFNYGIQGGVGVECFVSPRRYIYLNVGGNYGLMNVQKNSQDGQNQTGCATMAIGYAVKF